MYLKTWGSWIITLGLTASTGKHPEGIQMLQLPRAHPERRLAQAPVSAPASLGARGTATARQIASSPSQVRSQLRWRA